MRSRSGAQSRARGRAGSERAETEGRGARRNGASVQSLGKITRDDYFTNTAMDTRECVFMFMHITITLHTFIFPKNLLTDMLML